MAKILIVDDEEDVRMVTRTILERAGHEVIEAASGNEGLKVLENHKPDLVILDVMMPDMSGWGVCEKIKTNRGFRDIPVLMFTVKTEMKDMRHSRRTNADAHVNKPFGIDVLLKTVERLLESDTPA
jgi:CheY-like chemotaxis protein